jgi:peptidoglycan/LPS O-acetylase OafA/YrhL
MTLNKAENRVGYLDAIRGLAALSVLIFHVIGARWGHLKWWLWFFNGGAAVAMFFVLSGLVLSIKYIQNAYVWSVANYKKYLIARVFRLYPAFILMIFVYYIYAHWTEQSIDFWVQTFVKNPHGFWEELLLIRHKHDLFFPDWTLGIEVAVSVFVPFLIVLIRFDERLFRWFLAIIFIVGSQFINDCFLIFGLGILLAYHFESIEKGEFDQKWLVKFRFPVFLGLFFLFNFYRYLMINPAGSTFYYFTQNFVLIEEVLLSGVAAAGILFFIIRSKRLKKWLNHPVFLFFGKISYGIYLTHWFVLGYFQNNFDKFFGQFPAQSPWIFCIVLGSVLFFSVILGLFLYYFIEKPFIKIGKKWANSI